MNKASIVNICDKVMEYSLYILIFYLPISKAIIETCAGFAILAFIIKKIIARESLPASALNKYLFLYLSACAMSIFFTTNVQISLRTFFLKLLEFALVYFVIIDVMVSKRKIQTALTILLLSAMLVCIDGIFQYFTHIDFLRQRKWPYDLKPFTFRITGPFITKNDLAAYLAPILVFSWGLFFTKFKNFPSGILAKVSPVLLSVCLFLTVSRGAWLAVFIGFILLGFLSSKKFFVILFSVIISVALLNQFLDKPKKDDLSLHFGISDSGGRDRKVLIKISLDMFKSRPIFGLGLGTYMHNFDKFNYDKTAYPWGPSYAHNCYLQMAAEIGLFGLASFLIMLAALFYKSIKRIISSVGGFEFNQSIALLLALSTYLIHSVFDTNLYNLDIGMLFWVLLAISQCQLKLLEYKS